MHDSRIDSFDFRILDALQNDGRLTNSELADMVGLSASQCSRRRAALEDRGVVATYAAHLSPSALGLGLMVFVEVTFAAHSDEQAKKFSRLIETMEEVQEAYALTGSVDYMLKLIVPDLEALRRILNEVLLPHEAVAHIKSSIVLSKEKQTTRLPLNHLR
jgi:DNA-binding Lrp family transcriptional regulator